MRGALHVCVSVLLTHLVLSQETPEFREVETAQGPVRGHRRSSYNVFEFHNVPYATTPSGSNRFRAPLPPFRRSNILNAVDRGITCPQPNLPTGALAMEDCLVANILVPGTEQNNLPVLVIVHGGAYQVGDGSILRTRGFVDSQQVIVVTFNYRLAIHGFLCLGTELAPGNAGMKDQVALLRWLKDNIANFGGDPDNVTITGCGAGGSAVETLMLSKMTNGLFSKVIADSGCSTSPFGVQLDPMQNAKDHALRINRTNVNVEDANALTNFYIFKSMEILTSHNFIDSKDANFVFKPCVERYVGEEMFLDDAPINILRSGNYTKLPILYGYSNMGGMVRLNMFDEWKDKMNEKFSDFLPADLEFENDQEKEQVAQEVKQFYFGNNIVSENTILSFVDYFSDVMFITPVQRAVTLQVNANNSEVYLYDFSFVHNTSLFVPGTDVQGATHCDQVHAITDVAASSPEFLEMSRTMRHVFLNFMTTGKPAFHNDSGLTWLPSGANRSPHLNVGESFEMLGVPLGNRGAFWDRIYENHYRTPIPPNPYFPEPVPEPSAAALHLLTTHLWIVSAISVVFFLHGH